MKFDVKRSIAALLIILMLPLFIIPSSANSAQTYWYGRDEYGVTVAGGESPIVVEHETLTFDINELRDRNDVYDVDPEVLDSYLTAEYHFYNPSELTVTTNLAFPIGRNYPNDGGDYSVSVNGESIDARVRHTLSFYSYDFDLEKSAYMLGDEYIDDPIFKKDMTVTKYTVRLTDFDKSAYWVHYGIDVGPEQYPNTYFFVENYKTIMMTEGGARIVGQVRGEGSKITLYAIGERPEKMPEVKYYSGKDGYSDENVVSGNYDIVSTETLELQDMIFSFYNEGEEISRVDWYNSTIALLNRYDNTDRALRLELLLHGFKEHLMQWYCYQLEFAPGERIVNTVRANMLPSLNAGYTPDVCEYTYLLSPAATWSDFGSLDIIVNTPYYMIQSSLDGFEKTEGGYTLSLDGLPRESKYELTPEGIVNTEGDVIELEFSLCTEEDPDSPGLSVIQVILLIIVLILLLPLIIVAVVLYFVFYLFAEIISLIIG